MFRKMIKSFFVLFTVFMLITSFSLLGINQLNTGQFAGMEINPDEIPPSEPGEGTGDEGENIA